MSVVAFADPVGWPSTNTTPQVKELKNFSKKFEKPLDKPLKMWYNKSVKRGKEPNLVEITQQIEAIKKNRKNPKPP